MKDKKGAVWEVGMGTSWKGGWSRARRGNLTSYFLTTFLFLSSLQ